MPQIIQPKIHTRVRLWYRSGRFEQYDIPYQINAPLRGMMTDTDGKLHWMNVEHVESFELEHFDAGTGITGGE